MGVLGKSETFILIKKYSNFISPFSILSQINIFYGLEISCDFYPNHICFI